MFATFIQKVSTFLTFHKTVELVYDIPNAYSHSFPPNVVERTVIIVSFFLSDFVSNHNYCQICKILFFLLLLQQGKSGDFRMANLLQSPAHLSCTSQSIHSAVDMVMILIFLILRFITRLTAGYKSNTAWGNAKHHTMISKKLPYKLVAIFTNTQAHIRVCCPFRY